MITIFWYAAATFGIGVTINPFSKAMLYIVLLAWAQAWLGELHKAITNRPKGD